MNRLPTQSPDEPECKISHMLQCNCRASEPACLIRTLLLLHSRTLAGQLASMTSCPLYWHRQNVHQPKVVWSIHDHRIGAFQKWEGQAWQLMRCGLMCLHTCRLRIHVVADIPSKTAEEASRADTRVPALLPGTPSAAKQKQQQKSHHHAPRLQAVTRGRH